MFADVAERRLRALRANRVLGTDEKRIRTQNAVMDKNKDSLGFYTRSPMACGCAFHPRASDDPRGRAAVRASSIAAARCAPLFRAMPGLGHFALCAPTAFWYGWQAHPYQNHGYG